MELEKLNSGNNDELAKSLGKGLVLVVEDSTETAQAISILLNNCGYETAIAHDVKSAISFLKNIIPDLILSDLNFPQKSGADLFSETRKHSAWSEIPFLFMSGDGQIDVKQQNLRLGADNFLVKPIDPVELKATIEGKLLQARNRKQLEHTRFENFRKRIIHTLSHEFRTPLVSITTGTELLLDEYKSLQDEQVQTLLKSILKGGQRLERLVEDFMVMQQIDIGYAAKSFEQFKCIVSISEIFDLLNIKLSDYIKLQYQNAEVEFTIDPDVELKVAEVYPEQLVDALFRFVDNSLKFSSPKAKASIKAYSEDDICKIIIRDWGSGFDNAVFTPARCKLPFEQFNRDIYEQQGCGLGLSIASYFLSLHSIEVSISKPEDSIGTIVEISIPFAK